MPFDKWLDTFIEEKELDLEHMFTPEGASGTNYIPCEVIVEYMKIAPPREQAAIKATIVKIDFANGNILHYFAHLASALAR